jgi:hypothetical protein
MGDPFAADLKAKSTLTMSYLINRLTGSEIDRVSHYSGR